MAEQTLELKAQLYVYDLKNCAREYSFKADDTWEIGLFTEVEKTAAERHYHPTITIKVVPESILEMYHNIKSKLRQPKTGVDNILDKKHIAHSGIQYLVAFSRKRLK